MSSRVDSLSSLSLLVRATVFVLCAIRNFRKLRSPQPPTVTKLGQPQTTPRRNLPSPIPSLRHAVTFLSSNEKSASKSFLFRTSQHECFVNETKSSSNRKRISPKNRSLYLKPFLDSTQSLRAEGRSRKTPFGYCLKHPMMLGGQHHIVQLFITFIQNSNVHTCLKKLNVFFSSNFGF